MLKPILVWADYSSCYFTFLFKKLYAAEDGAAVHQVVLAVYIKTIQKMKYHVQASGSKFQALSHVNFDRYSRSYFKVCI
ncbi:MAG: hypothetical protein EA359_10205 [Balneolaceae bacterium]|nr:MAG: hypothetical protein EA359_10205 [Balneolaceae bacterium]